MVQTNGMLGRAGWELKACYTDPSKRLLDTDHNYNYFLVHEMLCNKDVAEPNRYHHALAFSLNTKNYLKIQWEIDEIAFNVLGVQETNLVYDAYDLEKIKDAVFHIIKLESPKHYRKALKQLGCLIWLNNLHYHKVFIKMLEDTPESLTKFIKIMVSLRYLHKNGECFAEEAYDIYNLPDDFVHALI